MCELGETALVKDDGIASASFTNVKTRETRQIPDSSAVSDLTFATRISRKTRSGCQIHRTRLAAARVKDNFFSGYYIPVFFMISGYCIRVFHDKEYASKSAASCWRFDICNGTILRTAIRSQRNARPRTARNPGAADGAEEAHAGGSALEKGFSLLERLVEGDHPLALAELTDELGLPKATIHRLLKTLEDARLVTRDLSGKRYVVGDRLTRLSLRAMVFSARMAPVRAILEGLVAELGESVNLGVLDGTSVTYLQRVECNWPLRTHLSAGSRVPLHCTATGKLFLALMPSALRAVLLEEIELHGYAPNTITNRKRLEENCRVFATNAWRSTTKSSCLARWG